MANVYELIRATGIIPASDQKFEIDDKVHRFRIEGERASRLSGTYQLTERPDGRIIGWVRDHRQALTVPIASGGVRQYKTQAEIEADRERIIQFKKQKQMLVDAAQAQAADRARKLWNGGSEEKPHPYLTRKGIPLISARVLRDILLVPVYDSEGKICNLQCIDPTGRKKFLKNGKKTGCMGAIPPAKNIGINTIYITEGYATGVSINTATGCPIALAFDCGNLINVVKQLRERHPGSRLIIAADNDQWATRPDGSLFNAGRWYAERAGADQIDIPYFPPDHPDRPTDWNDYAAIHGIEKLRECLLT